MSIATFERPQAGSRFNRNAALAMRYAVCITVAAIIVFPLVMAVVDGLKTNGQLLASPFALPKPFVWANYTDVLGSGDFWRQCGNSVFVMLATTLLVLGLASTAAFVFARFEFRSREAFFTYFSFGLLFPSTIAILPLYILIRQLGLVDTLWGIILPQVAFQLPISVLILRNFFISIPREIEDASYVDGATPLEFFWRILLPLARPGLSAVAVLTMVMSWNNFFLPLVVINTDKRWTLPLGVMQYQGQFGTDWGKVLAFVSLAMVPAIVFYLFAERQIIAGLTAGAVKG
ncbi:MAG: carbohydrate ABC transporter permease [Thermomicrobiales bacterium]|nr:carbohydrate ABC transporter permease [Thermomicrobiales bacterium]